MNEAMTITVAADAHYIAARIITCKIDVRAVEDAILGAMDIGSDQHDYARAAIAEIARQLGEKDQG